MNELTEELFEALPARRGHFLLESGYHTDLWLSLDALFVSPRRIAPLVAALACRLESYGATAVCGPLQGGAFLAQAVAAELGADFYFTEPVPNAGSGKLFTAEYRLPAELEAGAKGNRFAIVDDVISAGSSVRATSTALSTVGASILAVGTLLLLGDIAQAHFAKLNVPIEATLRREFPLWQPTDCPLCRSGVPLENPTRRK